MEKEGGKRLGQEAGQRGRKGWRLLILYQGYPATTGTQGTSVKVEEYTVCCRKALAPNSC